MVGLTVFPVNFHEVSHTVPLISAMNITAYVTRMYFRLR